MALYIVQSKKEGIIVNWNNDFFRVTISLS
jgi:hypothetical protein